MAYTDGNPLNDYEQNEDRIGDDADDKVNQASNQIGNRVKSKLKQKGRESLEEGIKKGIKSLFKGSGTAGTGAAAGAAGGAAAGAAGGAAAGGAAGGAAAGGAAVAASPVGWIILAIIVAIILIIVIIKLPEIITDDTKSKMIKTFQTDKFFVQEVQQYEEQQNELNAKNIEMISDLFSRYLRTRSMFEKSFEDMTDSEKKDLAMNLGLIEEGQTLNSTDEDLIEEKLADELKGLDDALNGLGSLLPSVDLLPYYIKMERQSYAWGYPIWNPIDNEIERKIVDLYTQLNEENITRVNKYVIRDYEGMEKFILYEYYNFSEDEIYRKYKSIFNKEDIDLVAGNLRSEDKLENLTIDDKKVYLKRQFDKIYKNTIKNFKLYFRTVWFCNQRYKESYPDKFRINETPLMCKTNWYGTQIIPEIIDGELVNGAYFDMSFIHIFKKITETLNLEYKNTNYTKDTSGRDFLYPDINDINSMIDGKSYFIGSSSSFKHEYIDLQQEEYSNRLKWQIIKAFQASVEAVDENNISEEYSNKEIDPKNVLIKILGKAVPYFRYVYPNESTPLKDAQISENVSRVYGDAYRNFDILNNTFNPFLPHELNNGNYDLREDNNNFITGELTIDEGNFNQNINKMRTNKWFLAEWLGKLDTWSGTNILKMAEDYIPANQPLYEPRNHEIITSGDMTTYYLFKKVHKNTSEPAYAYDGWMDSYTVTRRKEFIKQITEVSLDSIADRVSSLRDELDENQSIETEDYVSDPIYSENTLINNSDNIKSNELSIKRTIVREYPSLKKTLETNLTQNNITYWESSNSGSSSVTEYSLKSGESYKLNKYIEIYIVTKIKDEEGNVISTSREREDSIHYATEYHNIYEKSWNISNPMERR